MKRYDFVIADVFTEKRFGGNQLAVFTDARGLDAHLMQEITREMNYSETTFLVPPEAGGDLRIRIFTLSKELPFAGHPIVGSSFVVVSEKLKTPTGPLTPVTLETGVGLISAEVRQDSDFAGYAIMEQPIPTVRRVFENRSLLASALSVSESALLDDLPIEAIHNGLTVLIVPLDSLETVSKIKVDTGALEAVARKAGAETVLVFAQETLRPDSDVHCRVFAPGAGVVEDPATGSANGPLGFYLVRHRLLRGGEKGTIRIVSEQGWEMGRPSILNIEIEADGGIGQTARVRVGGGVVLSGRGEMFV